MGAYTAYNSVDQRRQRTQQAAEAPIVREAADVVNSDFEPKKMLLDSNLGLRVRDLGVSSFPESKAKQNQEKSTTCFVETNSLFQESFEAVGRVATNWLKRCRVQSC